MINILHSENLNSFQNAKYYVKGDGSPDDYYVLYERS